MKKYCKNQWLSKNIQKKIIGEYRQKFAKEMLEKVAKISVLKNIQKENESTCTLEVDAASDNKLNRSWADSWDALKGTKRSLGLAVELDGVNEPHWVVPLGVIGNDTLIRGVKAELRWDLVKITKKV